MAIKLVTGGTTGLQDGTLVSSGNRIVFTSTTPVAVHVRCDDGFWSADQAFTLADIVGVLPVEVSFDGGGTWLDDADNPVCPEVEDVNFPVLLRQTVEAAVGETARELSTDGSYSAISALSTPTLTATANGSSQIDLSWTNVANEDGYTVERSPNGSTGWTQIASKAAGVTTHSDTGLSGGTQYFYRARAEGSGRYSDSGWGTDDATTDTPVTPFLEDDFSRPDGTYLEGAAADTGGTWTDHPSFGSGRIVHGGSITETIRQADAAEALDYNTASPPDADYSVQATVKIATAGSGGIAALYARLATGAYTGYHLDYYDAASSGSRVMRLIRFSGGSASVLGSHTVDFGTADTNVIKLKCVGDQITGYLNGAVVLGPFTNSDVTAAGKVGIRLSDAASPSASNGPKLDDISATAE